MKSGVPTAKKATASIKTRSAISARDTYLSNFFRLTADGKPVLHLDIDDTIFRQGDAADSIYFIQSGKIRITVVSPVGKEVVLTTLGPRGFVGEGCLVGQKIRVSTATAVRKTTLYCIERQAMLSALTSQPELTGKFIASLLARNIDIEEDLCDQLFNHSEKRLARVLLKLARFGLDETQSATKLPRISEEALAQMVGTTRARVRHFMRKFIKLGLIDYDGEITVRPELLTDVVLHD